MQASVTDVLDIFVKKKFQTVESRLSRKLWYM